MKKPDHIDAQVISAKLLQEECGRGAYERGNAYFQQNRADIRHAEHRGSLRIYLEATTQGHGSYLYDQEIDIIYFRTGVEINGHCDCPVRYNCKHVVAACLTYRQQQASRQTESFSAESFTDWLSDSTSPPSQQRENIAAAPPEFLIYNLKPGQYGENVTVSFRIVRRKRNGDLGKGRSINFSTLDNSYTMPSYAQAEDMEIVSLLAASDPTNWSAPRLLGAAGNTALTMMLKTGRSYWNGERKQPLLPGEDRNASLEWFEEGDAYRLQLNLSADTRIIPVNPLLYIDPVRNMVGALIPPAGFDHKKIFALNEAPPIPRKEADQISRLLALKFPTLPTPTPVETFEIKGVLPSPQLNLHYAPNDKNGERFEPLSAVCELRILYDGGPIDSTQESMVQTQEREKRLVRIHRDLSTEVEFIERLRREGLDNVEGNPMQFELQQGSETRQAQLAAWFDFIETTIPKLQSEGWQIEQSQEAPLKLSHAKNIVAEVDSSENDWFELRFDIEVDGKKIALLPLISELIGDYRPGELPPTLYLPYKAGHFVQIESRQIEPILQNILDIYDTLGPSDELRLSRLDAPKLLDLGDTQINGGAILQKLAKKLRNFSGIKNIKLPSTFKGELRDYQQQGLNWLQFLREYGLAGILADDMGLGKTVQALAHLAIEKRAGRMKLPSLIIAPTSLMGNWRREAQQFTPGLRVLVLHGPDRSAHFKSLQQYDLILTTYPLLPRDCKVLQAINYHYLILDEAQVIKNHRSQAAQMVRTIKANHRLSLTGTPMENHLGELWSQFDFLLPGFLGTQERFVRNYRTPIEKHGDTEKLQRLTRRVTPFMLRRNKDMVAKELPAKSQLIRTVPIEGKQAALYESIRLTMEKKVREAISKQGMARSHITILDALLKLRQVCCDPRLLPNPQGKKVAQSAKFEMLMEMIPELLDEGRKILLFSQFTKMLGLIEAGLKDAGIAYTKLTGQTRKRDEAIERFRSGEVNLFLISLKAGGVGLNLTEADTVIHYDPWWNPAVETQATDRAHRIGQEKPVFVYKLLTEGTVEEKILAMQERKRKLADSVYSGGKKGDSLQIDAGTISELLAARE